MILIKNHTERLLLGLFIIFFNFINPVFGQKNLFPGLNTGTANISIRQDTAAELRKRNVLTAELPDTNFTWEKYGAFLSKISDTSKYIVLPLNEFRNTFNSSKIVIGLRHDVDIDLNIAYQFSETESKLGFRSTYFILHTAPYYLANQNNMALHTQSIIPILKTMQDDKKFEIGWHNDLVTLQVIYNIDPVTFLQNELTWLRTNGLNISGTSAHGSNYCKIYHYMNFYFFEEYTYPVVPNRENNISVPVGSKVIPIMKGKLGDFNLQYEAYFLNNNKAFSDATITNGVRWDIGMLDLNSLQKGDRVIILLHPIHWHKASVDANIGSFRFTGQKTSSIDQINSRVSVVMPYGTDKKSLSALFTLSPGAYAKVSGKLQVNGSTVNDFSNPLTYNVFAENRDVRKEWIVNVTVARNSAANFESFIIPDITKSVTINSINKSIVLELKEWNDLTCVPVQFNLSAGARTWIGNEEQFSNVGTIDLSNGVSYRVLAEDGISSGIWTVSVFRLSLSAKSEEFSPAGLSIYPNPSDGILHMQFHDIKQSPVKIDIYNTLGEVVYTDLIRETGSFIVEAYLTNLQDGIYFVKWSDSEDPVKIVIQKR